MTPHTIHGESRNTGRRMKVIANYTEVYALDENGNRKPYCWFLNVESLERQLAWLLLELQNKSKLSFRTIDGGEVNPLKDAEKQVVLTGIAPMPRGYIEHDGKVYLGYVREYREIELATPP